MQRNNYKFNVSERFKKEFRKLDKYTQKMLRAWINKNVVDCENPYAHGKGLVGDKRGLWRYRVGDYRIICLIREDEMIILALSIGHRKEIYQNF